eukprot:11469156-Alexandrium_andersonii.AAC.1
MVHPSARLVPPSCAPCASRPPRAQGHSERMLRAGSPGVHSERMLRAESPGAHSERMLRTESPKAHSERMLLSLIHISEPTRLALI